MYRLFKLGLLVAVALGIVCVPLVAVAYAKDIKVGAAINLTGPASTWGQFHAKGQKDYFKYVNEIRACRSSFKRKA